MKTCIGIDYGTNSCRAVVADGASGDVLGCGVYAYPSGVQGVLLDERRPALARQHPLDYLKGLEACVREALQDAATRNHAFDAESVAGIGVDTTGSSPLSLTADNTPLCMRAPFTDNLDAMCWLWKDHTAAEEADAFTRAARTMRPTLLAQCGGVYSSEWWWSKIWHCLKVAPDVFDAAASWAEIADWIPSVLAGVDDPARIVRGVCAAGHKALYNEARDGLPDADFLSALHPKLGRLRGRLYEKAYSLNHYAGALCKTWAEKLGLREGVAVAVGEFDVHYGAIAAGVGEGVLVDVVGTSACQCTVRKADAPMPNVKGLCGVVNGSILPGYYGVEAGQSAVGDLFKWWIEVLLGASANAYREFDARAQTLAPGQSGLLALDWNNGNRTVLVDARLTGLLLGQTLHTTREEIYRALVEATAFGARLIIERIESCGTPIKKIVCCGGIAEKSRMTMQIYADVLNREIAIAASDQTCALGAAIGGAVAGGLFKTAQEAQRVFVRHKPVLYKPIAEHTAVYARLFALYTRLHDAFGGVATADMGSIMKELLKIKTESRA